MAATSTCLEQPTPGPRSSEVTSVTVTRNAHISRLIAALLLLAFLTPAVAAPRQAPAFEVKLFSGKAFRLADYRGTAAVLLLFWAPW